MKLRVHNLHENRARLYQGSPGDVMASLAADYPWARGDTLEDVLDCLEASQGFQVEPLDAMGKSESSPDIIGQLGLGAMLDQTLVAAYWLHDGESQNLRKHLRENDLEAAVLKSLGRGSEQDLASLQAVQSLMKAEPTPANPPASVLPVTDSAKPAAEAVKRAFKANRVQQINLGGKHSAGSMIARDPESGRAFLLKPGSGPQSPALGISEEVASQARREAGFAHVARLWGMGNDVPRAEAITMDGHEWAALDLLDWSWRNLNKVRKEQPAMVAAALESLRRHGQLHRWAILEAVTGSVDSHGANEMIGPGGTIKLIDHGSAFAGPSFNPGVDDLSFVPYYLRCRDQYFDKQSQEDQLLTMPVLNEGADRQLKSWVLALDPEALQRVLVADGLNPGPPLARLKLIQDAAALPGPLHAGVNRRWIGLDGGWVTAS